MGGTLATCGGADAFGSARARKKARELADKRMPAGTNVKLEPQRIYPNGLIGLEKLFSGRVL
jgi:hypothetical protein